MFCTAKAKPLNMVLYSDKIEYLGKVNSDGKIIIPGGEEMQGDFYNRVFCSDSTLTFSDQGRGRTELSHTHIACLERLDCVIGASPARAVKKIDNGATTVGITKDGKMHGNTVTAQADGTIVEGVQVNGLLHGMVKHTTSAGLIVEGNYRHNETHGLQIMTYPSGEVEHLHYSEGRVLEGFKYESEAEAVWESMVRERKGAEDGDDTGKNR